MEGQINLGTPPGDRIKELAQLDEVKSIVEIGTWNGRGSTRCVLSGIEDKPDCEFYTLECSKKQFEIAKEIDPNQSNVHFLLGKIVEEEDLDNEDLVDEDWINESVWIVDDIDAMREVPNVLEDLPDHIDLLILDGGEFSTRKEFALLKDRSDYIFLDDTACRKNRMNREDLLFSTEFEIVEDHPEDRNGWSLFRRDRGNHLIQLNKLADLHDGKSILFCKTDYIEQIFPLLRARPRPCVLITGNSDFSITDDIAADAPECVVKWFAQNADTTDERVEGIPIGIENTERCSLEGHGVGWVHALPKVEALCSFTDKEPKQEIFANFSLDTHPSRVAVFDICKELDYVTTEVSKHSFEIKTRSYKGYVNNILDHKMTVCPRGNGIDCHRVWEVLYLGRVPIIKREKAMNHFESLPIIFLDDWEELKSLELLQERYNAVKDNSCELLDVEYWLAKVENAAQ